MPKASKHIEKYIDGEASASDGGSGDESGAESTTSSMNDFIVDDGEEASLASDDEVQQAPEKTKTAKKKAKKKSAGDMMGGLGKRKKTSPMSSGPAKRAAPAKGRIVHDSDDDSSSDEEDTASPTKTVVVNRKVLSQEPDMSAADLDVDMEVAAQRTFGQSSGAAPKSRPIRMMMQDEDSADEHTSADVATVEARNSRVLRSLVDMEGDGGMISDDLGGQYVAKDAMISIRISREYLARLDMGLPLHLFVDIPNAKVSIGGSNSQFIVVFSEASLVAVHKPELLPLGACTTDLVTTFSLPVVKELVASAANGDSEYLLLHLTSENFLTISSNTNRITLRTSETEGGIRFVVEPDGPDELNTAAYRKRVKAQHATHVKEYEEKQEENEMIIAKTCHDTRIDGKTHVVATLGYAETWQNSMEYQPPGLEFSTLLDAASTKSMVQFLNRYRDRNVDLIIRSGWSLEGRAQVIKDLGYDIEKLKTSKAKLAKLSEEERTKILKQRAKVQHQTPRLTVMALRCSMGTGEKESTFSEMEHVYACMQDHMGTNVLTTVTQKIWDNIQACEVRGDVDKFFSKMFQWECQFDAKSLLGFMKCMGNSFKIVVPAGIIKPLRLVAERETSTMAITLIAQKSFEVDEGTVKKIQGAYSTSKGSSSSGVLPATSEDAPTMAKDG